MERDLITEELDDSVGRGTNAVINPFHYFRSQSSQLSVDDKGPHHSHAPTNSTASSSSLPGAPSSSSAGAASAADSNSATPATQAAAASEHASTRNADGSSSMAPGTASAGAASAPDAIDLMQGLFALAKDEMGKLIANIPGGPPKGPAPHRKPHESMDFEDTESGAWRKVSHYYTC
jgi:hypothetical protein